MEAITMKLRKNRQLTIPAALRKALNLKAGDWLDVRIRNGKLILCTSERISSDPFL
jgi:AbrB family looped-hinge helix DNA binding protein